MAKMNIAIVPAKELRHAKRRLATLLADEERQELSLCMLRDVTTALVAARKVDRTVVVSPDTAVLSVAEETGCGSVREPTPTGGLNASLDRIIQSRALALASTVLVLPADLPAVLPDEIDAVLEALPAERGVVICPSQSGGTNAIAVRPPQALPFRFGEASFTAHRREAANRELPFHVMELPSLTLDIDDPQDIADLVASHLWKEEARAAATRAFLSGILVNSRIAAAVGASACLGGS